MENLPTPLSRVELYLAKACGMDVTIPQQPLSRLEQFLAILAGDTTIEIPTPMSLTEQWLAYVLGVTPDPLLAVEGACYIGNQKVDVRYFAVAAGMPGAVLPPAPQNRKEQYFANLNVGPSGVLKYVTGTNITLTDVVSGIASLENVYGDTYQPTYSGANIYNFRDTAAVSSQGVSVDNNGWITLTSDNTGGSSALYVNYFSSPLQVVASTSYNVMLEIKSVNGTSDAKLHLTSYHSVSQFQEDSEITLSEIQPGITKYILTTASNISSCTVGLRTYLSCSAGNSGTVTFRLSVLEDTSITPEDFVYQPYTGGIPAPNPDYPQPIQVVTGEQTVTVTGKNLFNPDAPFTISGDSNLTKTIIPTGVRMTCGTTNPSSSAYGFGVFVIGKLSNYIGKKVTLTTNATTSTNNKSAVYIGTCNASGGNRSAKISQNGTTGNYDFSISWDVVEDANQYLCVALYTTQNAAITAGDYVDYENLQLEIGTATPYEEYVAPQSYTIDLGSIELCKIGDYQDYIYKSGDDWYLHKEVEHLSLAISDMNNSEDYPGWTNLPILADTLGAGKNSSLNQFTHYKANMCLDEVDSSNHAPIQVNTNNNTIYLGESFWGADHTQTYWKTTYPSLTMELYYGIITTITDTKITDATLISQLNAIDTAVLPKPVADITISGTGTNLTAPLTIAYYGSSQ